MLKYIDSVFTGIFVPVCLLLAGLFYSVRLKFFPILKPRAVLRGLCSDKKGGGASSVKAVTLALAGTLGVGNIVGVSSAIYMGGFGSVFWMWVSAIVAMALKYAEIVLAMRHKKRNEDGTLTGSAMDYISDFFLSAGFKKAAKAVSYIFAAVFLLNAFTMGSMLQANAVGEALEGVEGIPAILVGAGLATVTFLIIRKGTSGMTALTNVLVPLMSVGYVIMSLAIIILDAGELLEAFESIFSSAFHTRSAIGGVGGYTVMRSVRYGVMRGLVSNEAGCGTAPTAHALANNIPAKQGMWGIFEVFVDTVLLCTMTALVVILEYDAAIRYGGNYMMMTLSAFGARLGRFAPHLLCAAVLCFGFATIICWAHYGLSCASFFSRRKGVKIAFEVIYCICVFIGAFMSSEVVWQLSELAMGIMTVINLVVLIGMSGEVKKETDIYMRNLK